MIACIYPPTYVCTCDASIIDVYSWLHDEVINSFCYNLHAMLCLKMKKMIAVQLLAAVVLLSYSKHQVDAQGNSQDEK